MQGSVSIALQDPLILLPGMMCDARLFAPQIAAFSAERPVMTMPLAGEPTMTGLAKRVLEHAPRRFALAGLSMGGIVAMEVIRLAPERVSRLALLDTNHLADPLDKGPIREAQVDKVRNGGLREVMSEEMKPNYLAEGPALSEILGLCMEMADAVGSDGFADQSRALQHRPNQTDTLRNISVPSLILCGVDDQLCPVERHELMRDLIPQSHLVVVDGAGHLPTLEQPEQTNAALTAWLRM